METLAAVVKRRVVALSLERAFELFTARMSEWWPLATHSVAGEDCVGVRFEPRAGGRVVELTAAGEGCVWAEVLEWEPPRRFVLSWHPNPEPEAASVLEVRFAAVDGGTQVDLTHTGWEAFGERGADLRHNYESGWDVVLAGLTTQVSAGA